MGTTIIIIFGIILIMYLTYIFSWKVRTRPHPEVSWEEYQRRKKEKMELIDKGYLKIAIKEMIDKMYFNIEGTIIEQFTFLDTLEDNAIKETLSELSEEYSKDVLDKLTKVFLANLLKGYVYIYNKITLMYAVDAYYILDADNNINRYWTNSALLEALQTDYKDVIWERYVEKAR